MSFNVFGVHAGHKMPIQLFQDFPVFMKSLIPKTYFFSDVFVDDRKWADT